MNVFSRGDSERARLAAELAGLRADVKALRTERDSTAQLVTLRQDVERLKLEKERLTETNDRKIRETEHRVGLLRTQQEHEVANARRETELSVREENLEADKQRFIKEMEFQRERLQGEVDRVNGLVTQLLERLPVIEIAASGSAASRAAKAG